MVTIENQVGTAVDEALVIPLHVPHRSQWTFAAISLAFVVGAVVWNGLAPSIPSVVDGGGGVAIFAVIWWIRLAAHRARGNAPLQIVATREGLASPIWRLPWNRISRIWIGPTTSGALQALHIEPISPEDVQWPRSRALRFNAWIGGAMHMSEIQILEVSVDRPLEEIAADLARIAGRPLGSSPDVHDPR
jgi:hypothetical protein